MHSKLNVTGFLLLALAIVPFIAPTFAGPIELISKPAHPPVESISTTPSGSSMGAILGTSNRMVFFASDAWNITTNPPARTSRFAALMSVYSFDLDTGTATMITPGAENQPVDGNSIPTSVSSDGRYLLFQSGASNLVENDNNEKTDVFVHDTLLKETRLISQTEEGVLGDGDSDAPRFLLGGKKVLFHSEAQNLRPGATNLLRDFFIQDRETGKIEWRSRDSLTNALGKEVDWYFLDKNLYSDPEGRWLVWYGEYAVGSNSHPSTPFVLFYDAKTGVSSNLTTDLVQFLLQNNLYPPYLSDFAVTRDGSKVAFVAKFSLVLRNIATGEYQVLAKEVSPVQPSFSVSGNKILFHQYVSNVVQAVVWDFVAGTNVIVSANSEGNVGGSSCVAAEFVGMDENRIVFLSASTNLVPGITKQIERLYLKDLVNGTVELIGPRDLTAGITSFEVSADGEMILFETWSKGVVPNDLNEDSDVFLLNLRTLEIRLVSSRTPVQSFTPSLKSVLRNGNISAGGSRVVFSSLAPDLAPNDTNGVEDVFVHDFADGQTRLLSQTASGGSGSGKSFAPVISRDGRTIVYLTQATNLVPETAGLSSGSARYPFTFVILENEQGRFLVNTNFLTSQIYHVSNLIMSDDSTRILMHVSGPGIIYGIWMYNVPTHQLQVMKFFGASLYYLSAMSEDGRWLNGGRGQGVVDLEDPNKNLSLPPRFQFWGTNGITFTNESGLVLSNLQNQTSQIITTDRNASFLDVKGHLAAYFITKGDGTSELQIKNLLNERVEKAPYTFPAIQSKRSIRILTSDLISIHTSDPLLPGDTNGFPEFYLYHISSAVLSRLDESNFPYPRWSNKNFAFSPENNIFVTASGDASLIDRDYNTGVDLFNVSLSQMLDSDTDGLLDSWERTHFKSLFPTGTEDFDGDGFSNAQEFSVRTRPADAASRFGLLMERYQSDVSKIRLRLVPENAPIQMFLERSDELGTNWEPVSANEFPIHLESTSSSLFYRMRLE